MKPLNIFHTEFVKPLTISFTSLNKLNIRLFNDDTSSLKINWRFLYVAPVLVLFNISLILYTRRIFSKPVDVSNLAYMVAVLLVNIQSILKAIIVLYKRADIEKLIIDLGNIWRTSNLTDKQQLKKKHLMKRLKWCQSIFYWSNILGTWQHLFGPLVVVLIRRFLLEQDCELKLPFGGVYPYDPTKSWLIYLPTYAFQTFTLLREIHVYVGSEFLMITLCANLAIQFTILREDLERVSPTLKSDSTYNQLSIESQSLTLETYTSISIQDFIRRHQKLIKLARQLDDIFNVMVFVNFIFINFNLCFFGFAAVVAQGTAETAHNSIGVFALLLPIYIFCYYGELLKEESLGIADSAYVNQWYKGDVQYQKIIMFIITRSQRPCYMTAIKHVPVTLNTFTKVLSTTWSYFSLLTSVYLRDD